MDLESGFFLRVVTELIRHVRQVVPDTTAYRDSDLLTPASRPFTTNTTAGCRYHLDRAELERFDHKQRDNADQTERW